MTHPGRAPRSLSAFTAVLLVMLSGTVSAQSVRVTFRYQPQASYVRVHFPGQFNNWGPNSNGTIAAGTPSQADSLELASGLWVKTITLNPGTYQYKIYRQITSTPGDWSWIPDPLNRVVIQPDQNSQLTVDSLVLFQVCAYPYRIEQNTFVVTKGQPSLSAGVFQPAGAPPPAISAFLDGQPMAGPGELDTARGLFTIVPPSRLADGTHLFKVVVSAGAKTKTDSVSFEIRSGAVQIQTPAYTTLKPVYMTSGVVLTPDGSGPDTSATSVTLEVGSDVRTVNVVNGLFSDSTPLAEGFNLIRVSSTGGVDSVGVTRIVNHRPYARASAALQGGSVLLSASATTDPDGQTVSVFRWFDDPDAPLGLAGQTGSSATVSAPASPGEYYFSLVAEDPDGNADTTRGYFIIQPDGSLQNPGIASNPEWAKKARVYFLFPKAASAEGTIPAAAARIPEIRRLGFNVIWMMPVMDNAYPINNGVGPGYNIVDFYTVAPEYGTNQDFKDFVTQAHAEGIKVILDVTPNHTGRFHPWAENARNLGTRSPYWGWYEHEIIPHNTNGLGQSLDAFGFNYYTGFSDQLLNYNWRDVDAQAEMIRVYTYWIQEFGLDGYRFDVYWGPHRRYGERYMGDPVREALKKIKPDILLLGEDDGTGVGTQAIYADFSSAGYTGGVDAAYDFKLYFNRIRNFGFTSGAVDGLHAEIDNGGYYPGPNSLYMRFMETQDEDRIYYLDPARSTYYDADPQTAFRKTMPMASVIFTCPGFPMVWNGQEVGWGYGLAEGEGKLARNRSIIDWEFQGKDPLYAHYQKLAHARGQFPAFTRHKRDSNGDGSVNASDSSDFIRAQTGNGVVYAFTRPYPDENGLTVSNFSGDAVNVTIPIPAGAVSFSGGLQQGSAYYLNELLAGTSARVTGADLAAGIQAYLPAYGSEIYIISTEPETLKIDNPIVGVPTDDGQAAGYELRQNFPNPFNPATTIQFTIADPRYITLRVYDLLGREVATLVDGMKTPGTYEVSWDAGSLASGIYVYRLTAGGYVESRKMMLVK